MVLHKYICWKKAPNNFLMQSNIILKNPLVSVPLAVSKTHLQEFIASLAKLLIFISLYKENSRVRPSVPPPPPPPELYSSCISLNCHAYVLQTCNHKQHLVMVYLLSVRAFCVISVSFSFWENILKFWKILTKFCFCILCMHLYSACTEGLSLFWGNWKVFGFVF